MIGSPNFGKIDYQLNKSEFHALMLLPCTGRRSVDRDLEAQAVVLTTDPAIRQALSEVSVGFV